MFSVCKISRASLTDTPVWLKYDSTHDSIISKGPPSSPWPYEGNLKRILVTTNKWNLVYKSKTLMVRDIWRKLGVRGWYECRKRSWQVNGLILAQIHRVSIHWISLFQMLFSHVDLGQSLYNIPKISFTEIRLSEDVRMMITLAGSGRR